jgi:outer membrane lipoprotein-sorting protein
MMHRRVVLTALSLTLGAGAALTTGRALAAQASVIGEVERYLNAIDTLEASFSQIAPNGELATGTVYIQRPGRLRFDYDPPSRIRLVAPGDWRLVFYDASIQQVNVIPVSQTPLGILLDDEIALDTDVEVTGIERAGDEVALTVIRKNAADQGSVTLVFGERPLALRRWSVTDAQGLVTHVLLENVETGGALDPELFRWRDPKLFGFPD